MLLLTTLSSGMISAYGDDGYQQVRSAVSDLCLAVPDAQVAILDDAVSMAHFGGPAAARDQDSFAIALNHVATVVGLTTAGGGGILILGGNDIFPAWSVANPVTDRSLDPDPSFLTDLPYGAHGSANPSDWLSPDIIPVGRICAGAGDPASALCAIVETLIANHQKKPLRAGYVEFTNREWQDASFSVITDMPGPGRLLISPDDTVTAANSAELDARFLYCNLHGFNDDRAWKGYDPVRRSFVTALSADSFSPDAIAGSVIYTEACYGLQTAARPTSGSCALSALAAGAAAVVGATGLAFGSLPGDPKNLIDADALARGFFQAALPPNSAPTPGGCLRAARASFLASSGASPDSYARKTFLQFQLLGDPTLVV
ncbi:MAG: C25 family cysteine peptidase [Bryobacteraceae bacterium]